ncbi:MAG: phosphoribosylglycinamide formyltransferase, partial [Kofleriaceae bacterium]|nr:phosphoribosylglycinamide formyltransferase [Kofleriaceae bacterium]
MRVAAFASGTGTNLQALIDSQQRGELLPAELSLVIVNKKAQAQERAELAKIPNLRIDHKQYNQRSDFEDALLRTLEEHRIDIVVLAGFMRILSPHFVDRFPLRILNTHPALCPAFPGVDAAQQAIEAGVKVTGCTVHFVDKGVDTGP